MKEKDYQIKFGHWVKNVYKGTACFELKRAVNGIMPFDAVVPHQIDALMAANKGHFFYKIPDVGYQNPFDCISLSSIPAYIVVCFDKYFELITIDTFLLEKKRSKRKSLTASRAREISTVTVKWKEKKSQ